MTIFLNDIIYITKASRCVSENYAIFKKKDEQPRLTIKSLRERITKQPELNYYFVRFPFLY